MPLLEVNLYRTKKKKWAFVKNAVTVNKIIVNLKPAFAWSSVARCTRLSLEIVLTIDKGNAEKGI